MKNGEYVISRKQTHYGINQIADKKAFAKFVKKHRKNLKMPPDNRECKTKDLAELVGIPYEQFRKIINMERPTTKRDCVIAICFALRLDKDETNEALSLHGMSSLNRNYKRDKLFVDLLGEVRNCSLSASELDKYLVLSKLPKLELHSYRSNKKRASESPYHLVKSLTECMLDELVYGDRYDSLSNEYSPERYWVRVTLWVEDSKSRQKFRLIGNSNGELSCEEVSVSPNQFKHYSNIDSIPENDELHTCYAILVSQINAELSRMSETLFDTRNYVERISARIIENELHIFYEQYNYAVPELSEYYFMDYFDGKYIFSVSESSRFMCAYLDEQTYTKYYKTKHSPIKEEYRSLEDIRKSIQQAKTGSQKEIMKLREGSFIQFKERIDAFIQKLTLGEVQIRNIEAIFDNILDVVRFYNVVEQFQSKLDMDGDIISITDQPVGFTIDNGCVVALTFDDLKKGFCLGLSSIDEIGRLLTSKGSLLISDLL